MDDYEELIESETIQCYDYFQKAKEMGKDAPTTIDMVIAVEPWHRITKLLGSKTSFALRIEELFKQRLKAEDIAITVTNELLKDNFEDFREGKDKVRLLADLLFAAIAILLRGKVIPTEIIQDITINQKDSDSWIMIRFVSNNAVKYPKVIAILILLADMYRKQHYLSKYRISQDILSRYQEEIAIFAKANDIELDEKQVVDIIPRIGIEIQSDFNTWAKVSQYRNTDDLPDNVRWGMCAAFVAVLQYQEILSKLNEKYGLLLEWIMKGNVSVVTAERDYIDQAGDSRPILASKNSLYSFRLRYGRARNTGGHVVGLHPATMAILGLTMGTQLFLDAGLKSCIVAPVTSIEPPLVRYKNGIVKRLKDYQKALDRDELTIAEIMQLGDILIDPFAYKGKLPIIGYNDDWWAAEARLHLETTNLDLELKKNITNFAYEHVTYFPSIKTAQTMSNVLNIPMHPKFTPEFSNLTIVELESLLKLFSRNIPIIPGEENIITPINHESAELIELLDKLLIPFQVSTEENIISSPFAPMLREIFSGSWSIDPDKSVLENINQHSKWCFKPKYTKMIAARCGRIEKAQVYRIDPIVHFLFPCGVQKIPKLELSAQPAVKALKLASFRCNSCGKFLYHRYCEECKRLAELVETPEPQIFDVNITQEMRNALVQAKVSVSEVKGLKELKTATCISENFIKGVLRSFYDLYVFKDGSSRLSVTNALLTHFTPKEINTSIKQLRILGYFYDVEGRPLTSEQQVVALKYSDIILNKDVIEYLVRVSQFVDHELRVLYNQNNFYNCQSLESLIGHLVLGIGKSTSLAQVGRVIGFCESKVCFAHPLWHSSKGSGIDGNEDSIILLGDAFLNCSYDYLPANLSRLAEYPYFISTRVDFYDIVSEYRYMCSVRRLPLDFFTNSAEGELSLILNPTWHPNLTLGYINMFYNQHVESIDVIRHKNSTAMKKTVIDRIERQLWYCERIVALHSSLMYEIILAELLNKELRSAFGKYFSQKFECVKCQRTFLHPPFTNRCYDCQSEIEMSYVPNQRLIEFFVKRQAIKKVSPVVQDIFEYLLGQRNLILRKAVQLHELLDTN